MVAVGLPSNTLMGADVFDTVVRSFAIKGSYVYVCVYFSTLMVGGTVQIPLKRWISWLVRRLRLFIR